MGTAPKHHRLGCGGTSSSELMRADSRRPFSEKGPSQNGVNLSKTWRAWGARLGERGRRTKPLERGGQTDFRASGG